MFTYRPLGSLSYHVWVGLKYLGRVHKSQYGWRPTGYPEGHGFKTRELAAKWLAKNPAV